MDFRVIVLTPSSTVCLYAEKTLCVNLRVELQGIQTSSENHLRFQVNLSNSMKNLRCTLKVANSERFSPYFGA